MAWHTVLVFRGDELIGQEPEVVTEGVTFYNHFEDAARKAQSFTRYTIVTVSAYELYMQPQRYTALVTDHLLVNREAGAGWMTRLATPLLSNAQAKAVAAWLQERSPEAWSAAEPEVKGVLDTTPAELTAEAEAEFRELVGRLTPDRQRRLVRVLNAHAREQAGTATPDDLVLIAEADEERARLRREVELLAGEAADGDA